MVLNKSEVLSSVDCKYEDIYVNEWDGEVRLWVLTAGERLVYESSFFSDGKVNFEKGNGPVELVALCMRDENGNRLFDDDHIDELKSKNATVISTIFEKCVKINWLDVKSVADVKKN